MRTHGDFDLTGDDVEEFAGNKAFLDERAARCEIRRAAWNMHCAPRSMQRSTYRARLEEREARRRRAMKHDSMVLVRHARTLRRSCATILCLQRYGADRAAQGTPPTASCTFAAAWFAYGVCSLQQRGSLQHAGSPTEDGLVHEHARNAPDLRAREPLEELDLRGARAPVLPDGRGCSPQ